MKLKDFPEDIQPYLLPQPAGKMMYRCLECGAEYDIDHLFYTCPHCQGLFLLVDVEGDRLKKQPGAFWRRLFDYRRMLNDPAVQGVFCYHELIAPIIPREDIVYLGECHTPQVQANPRLQEEVGLTFYFKNDGQNPSASFKDRGMAAALSYLNYIIRTQNLEGVLAICASTGDTSAAAALYAAYLGNKVASAVLLPHGKVTPQQLSQPLGAGARVIEIPGVFDDCMRVVEALSEHYHVALLNSKNSWRIRGQESYAYEVAQYFDYELTGKVIVVPIGNAGNITAVLEGLLRFHDLGVIETLPKVIGVQSRHANPVFKYYQEQNPEQTPVCAGDGAAQRGPGGHDRPAGVHAPGYPVGRGIHPPGRRPQLCGGGGDGTGDYGRHAAGQPQRPRRLHPGRRIAGRFARRSADRIGEQKRGGSGGRHGPPSEIHRFSADVL